MLLFETLKINISFHVQSLTFARMWPSKSQGGCVRFAPRSFAHATQRISLLLSYLQRKETPYRHLSSLYRLGFLLHPVCATCRMTSCLSIQKDLRRLPLPPGALPRSPCSPSDLPSLSKHLSHFGGLAALAVQSDTKIILQMKLLSAKQKQ